MIRGIFIFSALLFANAGYAQPAHEIGAVEIREVADDGSRIAVAKDCSAVRPLGEVSWDEILTIGQKLLEIVKDNKPVVRTESPVVHALPRGLPCWLDLEAWQAPKTKSYEVLYKNKLGSEVVRFRFRLQFTYGGSFKSRGRYLANVTVVPADLSVKWGYTFNANVNVDEAVNRGSSSSPVAGLGMTLKWTVSTWVKENQSSVHFFVDGNGNIQFAD